MKRNPFAIAVPALLAVVWLVPAAASAQTAPGAATAGAAPAAPASKTASGMLNRVDARIADLHAKLHITAAQDPQWRQFARLMREGAVKMQQKAKARAEKFRELNAVENMQSYAAIARQHAENMERLVPAFEKLYHSLSAEQKHTADELWRNYAARGQPHHKG